MKSEAKRIWIDLDNSPHDPFFRPIIEELERRGYLLTLTARDAFQVADLTKLHSLQCKSIGRHFGKDPFMKVLASPTLVGYRKSPRNCAHPVCPSDQTPRGPSLLMWARTNSRTLINCLPALRKSCRSGVRPARYPNTGTAGRPNVF